jgi:branched-chain amino acid transport system permease protein
MQIVPQSLHTRWAALPSRARTLIPSAVLLVVAVLLPRLTTGSSGWLPQLTLVFCAVYALFAMGLNIVVGYAGLLDLGYVAFFLFGAYVAAWLMSDFWHSTKFHFLDSSQKVIDPVTKALVPSQGIHLSFWIVMVVAAVVAALAGVLIGWPTLRLKSDYLALVTLGFGEILPEVFRNGDNLGGFNLTNGTKGIGPLDKVGNGFLHQLTGGALPKAVQPADHHAKYYIIMFFCALFVYVSIKLRGGKLGRAWLAIREDELAASLMGVPLMRTKLWSYAIGAAAGGFAGTFYATTIGIVNVDTFIFAFSIIVLCAVILGGMGNVWGAIVGGLVITWFNYTGLTWIGAKVDKLLGHTKDADKIIWTNYQFGFFGLVLVLMMLFRPQGLIPAARQKQVAELEKQIEQQEVQPA